MNRTIMFLIASFGLVVPAVPQNRGTIPAGTVIRVRTDETIDANNSAPGRMFTGVVAENATDRHGNVVIPKGSPAELAVRRVSKHQVSLDLATVTARGRTYAVASSPESIYGTKKPGIGKNKRTAKFIGGGGRRFRDRGHCGRRSGCTRRRACGRRRRRRRANPDTRQIGSRSL